MQATMDTPASAKELDSFWGEDAERKDTSAADAVRNAIREIKDSDMTAAVVAAILETLNARLAASADGKTDDGNGAVERIDDAIHFLEAM